MQWHSQYSKQRTAMQPCRFQFAVSRLFCRHLAVAINGAAETTMHNWLRVTLRQRSHSSKLTNDEFTYNAIDKVLGLCKMKPLQLKMQDTYCETSNQSRANHNTCRSVEISSEKMTNALAHQDAQFVEFCQWEALLHSSTQHSWTNFTSSNHSNKIRQSNHTAFSSRYPFQCTNSHTFNHALSF